MHIHDLDWLALRVAGLGGDDYFTKVLFLLDPVQLDLEACKLVFFNVTLLQE
jgi:hypothetical protein